MAMQGSVKYYAIDMPQVCKLQAANYTVAV